MAGFGTPTGSTMQASLHFGSVAAQAAKQADWVAWTGATDCVPETTDSVMFWALTERAAKTPETTMVEKRMLMVLVIESGRLYSEVFD